MTLSAMTNRLPNGLELSCPAARASAHSFSRNLAGKSRSNFPHASRVSCSELLGCAHYSCLETVEAIGTKTMNAATATP